jgi:uncharacterized membrane protein
MPRIFTWYLWDSRVTWLSGFALLILVYYMQADLFLIDKAVMDLTPLQAGIFSLVTLLVAWFAYDALCRSPLGEHEIALAIVVYIFLVFATYAFTEVLSGRAAVNQIGAIVGTFMVANAFTVIHPNQRKSVNALFSGQRPAPELVIKARQRSIHNNYLTLPVILLMISNHYPLLYATRFNWVIVAIVLALGPFIRHFFNTRNAGKGSPWWTWGVVAVGMLAVAYLSSFGPREKKSEIMPNASFAEVKEIVTSRCSMCHMQSPVWAGLTGPGGGIVLDNEADIRRYAERINITAVKSNAMPPGNVTEMTPKERATLASWLGQPRGKVARR